MPVLTEVDTNDVFSLISNEEESAKEASETKKQMQKKVFIVCDDCLWCATALSISQIDIDELCPNCHKPLSWLKIANSNNDNEDGYFQKRESSLSNVC
jgi:hypothetical protein